MHCVPAPFTIGLLVVEMINDTPDYQRESGIWSPDKKQLFLDSILNNYDIPKLYLHDLRGVHAKYKYAVIDGKQRLHTIWDFVDGKMALADDFQLFEPEGRTPPKPGSRFSELTPEWQEIFKSKPLDFVLVQNAESDDIEELFSRLNNGEPLNAAEKRNAMGGDMCALIRDVAKEKAFSEILPFRNDRFQHYEVAIKLILIERKEEESGDPFTDLKKRFLDTLVKNNKHLTSVQRDKILARVSVGMKSLKRVFGKRDPLLAKQAAVPMYYLFVKIMESNYASKTLYADMKAFLEKFQARRIENLQKKEEDRDPTLSEFGRLMQQGTNDVNSIRDRVSILRRYFLLEYPDIELRDKKRAFTPEERYAIYILGNKKCAECGIELSDISEMEADHESQWAHGGKTQLANARAFCQNCNKSLSKKVQ